MNRVGVSADRGMVSSWRRAFYVAAFLLCSGAMPAAAQGIQLGATRVILAAGEREASLQVDNTSKVPVLVQAWIDDGDSQGDPAQMKTPFFLSDPLLRIDAESSKALRIISVESSAPPADREALYYLNVLNIPQGKAGDDSQMQLAVRSRIKLFQRPEGLAGTAADAPGALRWQWNGQRLQVENPTPWTVNLTTITVDGAAIDNGDGVLAPKSIQAFDVPSGVVPRPNASVQFGWVDDSGAEQKDQAQIAR